MEVLITQLFDLRSVITKEVCKTISLMAEILQAEFDSHAPMYLSGTCLFKLMESGNHVMAEHAHLAVLSILYNSSSMKLLKIILKQALDKHIYTRINCAEYILLILMNTLNAEPRPVGQGASPSVESPGTLDKYAADLMKYIQAIIRDSNAEVRKRGRMILIVFENVQSEMVQHMIKRLDQSNRKSIHDEYVNFGLDPAIIEAFSKGQEASAVSRADSAQDVGHHLQSPKSLGTERLVSSKRGQRLMTEPKSRAALASSTPKQKKGSYAAYLSNLTTKGVATRSISFIVGTNKAQNRFGFSGSGRQRSLGSEGKDGQRSGSNIGMGTANLRERLEKNNMHQEELSANACPAKLASKSTISRPGGSHERNRIGLLSYQTQSQA